MTISGKVKDIERRDVDGEPRVSFWLEQAEGRRIQVEVLRGEQVTLGEQLEIEGKMNSEGTLVADRVTRPKKPEPEVVARVETPPPIRPDPPKTNWKLWGGIGAAVLVLIVVAVVATSGGDDKTVPEVTGLSEAQATTRLVKAGMRVGAVRLEVVGDNDVGKVIAQTPAGGAPLPQDAAKRTATLVLGAVGVPKLIDSSIDTAALELKRKGLTLGQARAAPRVGGNNLVIDQTPGVGAAARRGDPVSFTFAPPINIRFPLVYQQLQVRPDFKRLDRSTQLKLQDALK